MKNIGLKRKRSKYFVDFERFKNNQRNMVTSINKIYIPRLKEIKDIYSYFTDEMEKHTKFKNKINANTAKEFNENVKSKPNGNYSIPNALEEKVLSKVNLGEHLELENVKENLWKGEFLLTYIAFESYLHVSCERILKEYLSINPQKRNSLLGKKSIAKKIHNTFYGNFTKKIFELLKNIDFAIPKKLKDLAKKIEEIKQHRNLLIHKNGRVDQRYLNKVSSTNLKIGDTLDIDENNVNSWIRSIHNFVKEFDQLMIKKYPQII